MHFRLTIAMKNYILIVKFMKMIKDGNILIL